MDFLPENSSIVIPDALSMDKESWYALHKNCNLKWHADVKEFDTVLLLNNGLAKRAAANVHGSDLSAKQHLKIAVLLGYTPDSNSSMAQFCLELDSEELRKQCFSDLFVRMERFHDLQSVTVLSFWFNLVTSGSVIAEDLRSSANDSKNSVIAEITNEISIGCKINQRCSSFASIGQQVKKYFLPTIITEYFKNDFIVKNLVQWELSDDVACFKFNQIYLQMKTNKQLDTMDALHLRVLSQEPKTRDDPHLCAEVESAFLQHTPAHAKMFLEMFDKREFNKIRNNKLTEAVFDVLVKERYNDTEALMNLTWSTGDQIWYGYYVTEFACIGSLAMVKQMALSGDLATSKALSLFLIVNKHRTVYTGQKSWTKKCKDVLEYAPHLVKCFLYGNKSFDCCVSNQTCQSLINYLDSFLGDNNWMDQNNEKEYSLRVLFVGYVLQSLKIKNESQIFQNEIARMDTVIQARYQAVIDALVLKYLDDDNATLYLQFTSLKEWFNVEMYAYFLAQVVHRVYAKQGIGRMTMVLYNSDQFMMDIELECEIYGILYKEIEKTSQLDSWSAFNFWLFLEGYVLTWIDNRKCREVEVQLRNSTRDRLEDYLQAWDDPSKVSMVFKSHKICGLCSPWMLSKLVRHVFTKSNATNKVEKLINFFNDLLNMSFDTDKNYDLCDGLQELVHQMKNRGDFFNRSLKADVVKLFPKPIRSFKIFRFREELYRRCLRAANSTPALQQLYNTLIEYLEYDPNHFGIITPHQH